MKNKIKKIIARIFGIKIDNGVTNIVIKYTDLETIDLTGLNLADGCEVDLTQNFRLQNIIVPKQNEHGGIKIELNAIKKIST